MFDLNRQNGISCLRFTPDGRFLIITCHKDIVIFNAQSEEFEKVGLLKGNTQRVNALQFDKASMYAISNAVDGSVTCW